MNVRQKSRFPEAQSDVPEAIDELKQFTLDVQFEIDAWEDFAHQAEPQLDLGFCVHFKVGVDVAFVLYQLQRSGLVSNDHRELIMELLFSEANDFGGYHTHAGQQ